MFYWDQGLFLTTAQLPLDVRRRQPRGFISHAHADHIGPHELALCTPETALLYQHRRGQHRRTLALPYREPLEFGGMRLTTFPAGHCLGSAMLLAEDLSSGGQKLLYTGDFKLGPSATAAAAELPRADILVMECTFGRPRYRFPPRQSVAHELVELVRSTLVEGRTPVLHLYPLGKGQEITRLLTLAGIRVLQHPVVYAISQIYRECGVDLGDVACYAHDLLRQGDVPPGHAVVTLPRGMAGYRLAGIRRPVSIVVSGWAVDESTKYRQGVDHALPLSDHADYDELLATVEQVGARQIYCTHGPPKAVEHMVDHLRGLGLDAFPVSGSYQRKLF
jgi:putative mRNA 3-end processing factor